MPVKKNIGNLVEIRENTSFKWKVEDFFSQIVEVYECWDSPTFYLSGTQWYLRLYPNGKEDISAGHVSIDLVKERAKNKAMDISFTIGLVANDDSVYMSSENTFTFEEYGVVCTQLIERSQLLKDKEKIASEGVLTFYFKAQVAHEDIQIMIQNNPLQGEEVSQPLSLSSNSSTDYESVSEGGEESELPSLSSCATVVEVPQPTCKDLDALTQAFLDFFRNGKYCDITLRIGDYEIQAHRLVLVIRSSVFASELGKDVQQKKQNSIIDLKDVNPEVVEDFLHYLYTSEMKKVSTKHAVDLYILAQKYNVQHLSQKCIQYIGNNFTAESFCDIACLAVKFNETELLKSAEKFFIRFMKDILVTASWLSFMEKHSSLANKFLIKLADKVSM